MRPAQREPLPQLGLLLAALALAWAPHAGRFSPWFTGAMALLLGVRFGLAYFGLPLPGRWLLLPATASAAVWVVTSFRPFFGSNGAIALLTVMIVLKLFEMEARRDRMILALLGYVLAATRFIYVQTPLAALWMLGLACLFTYILAESADEERSMGAGEKARLTGRLLLLSAPVALVLFLVFPRSGAPLFALRGSGGGVTGLSEEMRPGSVTRLVLSEEIVFRARLADPENLGPELYWRGPVLEAFDGTTWRVAPGGGGPPPGRGGPTLSQELVVQPGVKWITPLDYPLEIDGGLSISPDGVVKAPRGGGAVATYTARSQPDPVFEPLDPGRRRELLQLPERSDPRVEALAAELTAGAASDREAARRILAYFRNENFVYTLKPPPLGSDPVAEFLFLTREGFCEHYASAFAVLLRHVGIPSRVVTGYLGGEYNPFGGHWIVQELHSHAWVEGWFEGRGWTRLDPTAAVSPERVHSGIDRAASLSSGVVHFNFGKGGTFGDLRFAADYLGFWWEEWVVGFGQEKQRRLLDRFGLEGGAGLTALIAATVGAPVLFLLLLGALHAKRRKRNTDRAGRLWERFLRGLEKKGIVKAPHEPPEAFAGRVAELLPALGAETAAVAETYLRCRYGKASGGAELAALKKAVESFEVKLAKG